MKSRLIFALAACLLLSNCGLISTAIRLAPYYFLLADEGGRNKAEGKNMEMRAREVQGKGTREIPHFAGRAESQVVLNR